LYNLRKKLNSNYKNENLRTFNNFIIRILSGFIVILSEKIILLFSNIVMGFTISAILILIIIYFDIKIFNAKTINQKYSNMNVF